MIRRALGPLRRRVLVSTILIVGVSIGITFVVGSVLTRGAVERANLDDLSHQADLLAQREENALLAFSKLKNLQPFLDRQKERIEVFDVAKPTPFVPDRERALVADGRPARGKVTVDGTRYLYAARKVQGKGFALLRQANQQTAGWGAFLKALLIAGLVGGALAAIASFLVARAVARPVRHVADASRSLAEGVSPDPVPVEGSAELQVLARSFNHMADQLQRAREAERNFLLSVSHELKTPLAAIRGYAEALEDGVFGPDEAAVPIRVEARRLERLVRDLLELARMNRREFTVVRAPLDLAEIALEAVRRHEGDARGADIALDAVAGGRAPAEGDFDRTLQVVSNLVENAIRSTPPGGTITVTAAPGSVSVADTGVGLAPEDVPHAFERFYLHDRNPDGRKKIGSGLGLAIVKELVDRMGGQVAVESEVGRGTTFRVTLPRGRALSHPPETISRPRA